MTSSTDVLVRRRRTSKQRQQLLARFHQSQLTQRDFAARHSIGLSTFGKWLRRESKKNLPPVQFQEVILPAPNTRWAMEFISPQGWTVRLQQAPEVRTLQSLLRALPC